MPSSLEKKQYQIKMPAKTKSLNTQLRQKGLEMVQEPIFFQPFFCQSFMVPFGKKSKTSREVGS